MALVLEDYQSPLTQVKGVVNDRRCKPIRRAIRVNRFLSGLLNPGLLGAFAQTRFEEQQALYKRLGCDIEVMPDQVLRPVQPPANFTTIINNVEAPPPSVVTNNNVVNIVIQQQVQRTKRIGEKLREVMPPADPIPQTPGPGGGGGGAPTVTAQPIPARNFTLSGTWGELLSTPVLGEPLQLDRIDTSTFTTDFNLQQDLALEEFQKWLNSRIDPTSSIAEPFRYCCLIPMAFVTGIWGESIEQSFVIGPEGLAAIGAEYAQSSVEANLPLLTRIPLGIEFTDRAAERTDLGQTAPFDLSSLQNVENLYRILGGHFFEEGGELDPDQALRSTGPEIFTDNGTQAKTHTNLIEVITSIVSAHYHREGLHRLPAKVPKNLRKLDNEKKDIYDRQSYSDWLLEQILAILGQFPAEIKVRVDDVEQDPIVLSSVSSAFAELIGLLLRVDYELTANTGFSQIAVTESTQAKTAAIQSRDIAQVIGEWLGFRYNLIEAEMNLPYTPNKSNYAKTFQDSTQKFVTWDNAEKVSVAEYLSRIHQATELNKLAIIRKVTDADELFKTVRERAEKESSYWEEELERIRNIPPEEQNSNPDALPPFQRRIVDLSGGEE